ncbi:MAG TPA: hypothetical protein VND70_10220 [Acidimicrobiales bacterium]|nr:hypothetical protein [Acidimicrobiales bacterium]
MNDLDLAELVELSLSALDGVAEADCSIKAGQLEWSCWQTVEHSIDCLFSYSMQIGAQAHSGFIPLEELHARPEASPADLIAGLRGAMALLLGVVRDSPGDVTASDGVLELDLSDWCARAAYELIIHTHDVLSGLGSALTPTDEMCNAILETESLWMLDRRAIPETADPWTALLVASGRPSVTSSD